MTLLGLERGEEAATNPILFRAELDRLLEMAHERGAGTGGPMRDRLADAYIRCETMRFLGLRILTEVLAGGTLGRQASVSKLYWSQYHQRLTSLAVDVLGADAMVVDGRLPLRAYRTDDPGRGEHLRFVARCVLERDGRDHLRRNIRGAEEHPRRGGPGAPEGTDVEAVASGG